MSGFDPVWSERSRALILGTWPSPKSFAFGFYYGHPQNRFWPLLARLAGKETPMDIAGRRALILNSGLAIWDTIEDCAIIGASDASIRDVKPRDMGELFARAPIEAVFCNGAKAYELYQCYQYPVTHIPARRMPSTSPANAAWSLDRLTEAWSMLREYMSL